MGKKVIIYIMGTISILCFLLGGIGLFNKLTDKKEVAKPDYKIKYNYYLDDEEIEEIPINKSVDKVDYVFSRYSCTNKVIGTWDNKNWEFVPELSNNATCKLYFYRDHYKITFEIEYGELRNQDGSVMSETDKAKDITVQREKNLVANIKPDEGYTLVSVECDKKNITDWNKENNELTVKNIKSDTKCTVKFAISSYEVDIKVSNGTGATSLTSEHGKTVNASISPTSGYGNPEVICTNGQKGTWKDNKFTIDKISNETSCTIEFKLLTFEIKVNVIGGTATPSTKTVNYNSSKDFEISASEGYTVSVGYGVTGCSNGTLRYSNNKLILTVSEVTSNITCNVTLKVQEVSSTEEPEE